MDVRHQTGVSSVEHVATAVRRDHRRWPVRRRRRRRHRRREPPPRARRRRELDPGIRQLHSSGYHNPSQLLPGPVLVVGAGQSGADIALEIARAGHETWLSGRPPGRSRSFGSRQGAHRAPVLWFLANHVLTVRTPIGRRMQPEVRDGGAPLVRVKRADLAAAGVHLTEARTVGGVDGRPELEDGTVLDVANVVWCTGFRQDFSLIHPAVTGEDGWPRDEGGVVPEMPGPVLRRAALPARLRLDADRRRGPGCAIHRRPHPPGQPGLVARLAAWPDQLPKSVSSLLSAEPWLRSS